MGALNLTRWEAGLGGLPGRWGPTTLSMLPHVLPPHTGLYSVFPPPHLTLQVHGSGPLCAGALRRWTRCPPTERAARGFPTGKRLVWPAPNAISSTLAPPLHTHPNFPSSCRPALSRPPCGWAWIAGTRSYMWCRCGGAGGGVWRGTGMDRQGGSVEDEGTGVDGQGGSAEGPHACLSPRYRQGRCNICPALSPSLTPPPDSSPSGAPPVRPAEQDPAAGPSPWRDAGAVEGRR